jgi:hypothetical protein
MAPDSCRKGFKLEALRRLFDFRGHHRQVCDAAAAAEFSASAVPVGALNRIRAAAQHLGAIPRVDEPVRLNT